MMIATTSYCWWDDWWLWWLTVESRVWYYYLVLNSKYEYLINMIWNTVLYEYGTCTCIKQQEESDCLLLLPPPPILPACLFWLLQYCTVFFIHHIIHTGYISYVIIILSWWRWHMHEIRWYELILCCCLLVHHDDVCVTRETPKYVSHIFGKVRREKKRRKERKKWIQYHHQQLMHVCLHVNTRAWKPCAKNKIMRVASSLD